MPKKSLYFMQKISSFHSLHTTTLLLIQPEKELNLLAAIMEEVIYKGNVSVGSNLDPSGTLLWIFDLNLK